MLQDGKGLVTVFGGSGFVGTQIVQAIARMGYRVRVAVRRPDLAGHVRMFGITGQVQPVQANIRNKESVLRAAAGADVIVNLVGILHESGRQKFRAVQTMGARNVAEAAAQTGAARLVHMSAIGADADSPSAYARTKALGEDEVRTAFPSAIIMRPSIIFGPDDGFFNLFAGLARMLPVMPVIEGDTRFQPIYVADVADAFAMAVDGQCATGKTYELGGPEVETMRDLLVMTLREANRKRPLLPVPTPVARAMASVTQILHSPLLTVDQVVQLGIDNVVSDEAKRQKRTLAAFGIVPTALETILPTYLWRFRKTGQFERVEV